jgi:broad specificity phosphatase PhoE
MYLAAVFANGNVTTGGHHGEAFAKLSSIDQEADLVSGHVNPDGTFTTELDHYIDKEIIIVRHAESEWNNKTSSSLDSSLSFKGVSQANRVANFIKKSIDCRGLVGFTSPFNRCLLTSMPIRKQADIRFFVRPELAELTDTFPDCGVEVPCRSDKYLDVEWGDYCTTTFNRESQQSFLDRLRLFLDTIPNRSLIVTHGSVVQTLIEMALGVKVYQVPTWDNSIGNASVTHIKNGTVILLAKNVT